MPSIASLSPLVSRIYYSSGDPSALVSRIAAPGPFRPPQWAYDETPLTIVATDGAGNDVAYIFDGVIRAEHAQQSVVTLNPVQTGAAISDHAYVVPARLTVELVMSDAMQAYSSDQWQDGPTKSAAAFSTLDGLQRSRQILQVSTRLKQYDRMVITEAKSEETKDTKYGLRVTLTFTQILTASVEVQSSIGSINPASSTLPQSTGQTLTGQIQSVPVPDSIQRQNSVANVAKLGLNLSAFPVVAAAGNWSSTSIASLAGVALR